MSGLHQDHEMWRLLGVDTNGARKAVDRFELLECHYYHHKRCIVIAVAAEQHTALELGVMATVVGSDGAAVAERYS